MTCDRSINEMGCTSGYNGYYQDCCLTKGWVIGLWSTFAVVWILIILYAVCRARRKAMLRNEMLIKATTRGMSADIYGSNYYAVGGGAGANQL